MDYLIDKYREIGNEKEAAYWQAYRDAADSAIASMNRLSEIAETAEAAMALGLFDAAEEGFEKALPICRELLKIENGADCHFPDSERENVQKTYRTLSRDYAAVVYFQYEDHARVIQMLEEADWHRRRIADADRRELLSPSPHERRVPRVERSVCRT